MKLSRTVSAAFTTALVAALFACASPEDERPDSGPTEVTTTVSAPRSSAPTTSAASQSPLTPPPTLTTRPSEPCANPTLDLMSTAFGAWLGPQIIATDAEPRVSYSFNVRENQFDPCASLSWVSLDGVNGSPDVDPGSAEVYTVVFFAGEGLITSPSALQFPGPPTVTRISGDQLRVIYRNGGDHPVIHQLEGSRLHGEEQLPADLRAGTRLDFTRAGPPSSGAPRPFGNARYRPWDHDRPLGRWYSVPMGESVISCDFEDYNAVQLACIAPRDLPWPLDPPDPGNPGAGANLAVLNFRDPARVDTSVVEIVRPVDIGGGIGDTPVGVSNGAGAEPELLRSGSVTRIADMFIDTRSEVVKIHTVDWAFLLGVGVAEPVEVPSFQLDLSRHPVGLEPWTG